MRKRKQYLRFGDLNPILLREDLPYYGNIQDYNNLIRIANQSVPSIKRAKSIRLAVIETWLLVDLFVREALANAFRMKEFNYKDFDLRHELLPIGFKECLNVLHKIIEIQRQLPENPEHHRIQLPVTFQYYLKKNHPDFESKLREIEQLYYKEHHPRLVTTQIQVYNLAEMTSKQRFDHLNDYYCADTQWIRIYGKLDEKWFKAAERVNRARNMAAHSYNASQIFQTLGYNGNNSLRLAKKELLKSIEVFLGIKYSKRKLVSKIE